jgi:glutathione S-transferase
MYTLYIANKNYSSWSLRPWVLMSELQIPFREEIRPFRTQNNFDQFRTFSPTGKVPCLVDEGRVIWDSLAITEYLYEQYPAIWPDGLDARTFARCAAAEMHAGFSALRNSYSMNVGVTVELHHRSADLARDLERLGELWLEGLDRFGGPFLAGNRFTAADAFFCPVAFRIQSYGLTLPSLAMQYAGRLLDQPSMKRWQTEALAEPWRDDAHESEIRGVGTITADRRQTPTAAP